MRSKKERDLRQESKNHIADVKVQKQYVRALQTKLKHLTERCDKVDDEVESKATLTQELFDK